MKTTLNLIPPEKRKILYNIYLLFFFKIIAELLLLYSAIIGSFLIWAKIVLNDNLEKLQQTTFSMEAENKSINNQVMNINQILKKANLANLAYNDWSVYLVKLSNIKNDGISLSGVDLQKKGQTIILQGKALSRQNLLDYQKNLEIAAVVKNPQIPITVLTAKENIDFEIKGEMILK
ncbi:MAG: hypothetical protein UT86_C0008G0007 [Candidatus Magasanikbacteria bacterium GW2011_GWC2_40_17]|uniref:Fimbrial assembly family protein n=1 Tax=Candidatus Magasanikbacteria bacterium GW2011_GWA2_42_32 TaxID=1619039 RepID=A0A0G1A640_9BACT|nr:MAG: hypothetical protein UT86_C0008G0007 [Candidatus Magasanikbacteria bacterium GW2011_GWC2_40_17]KKS56389.1 MAG: hypothetical protein UV20_C0013G0007 [Candidatus Magasanikbacteria bacterium GW2011_GWA2_42_32]OGH85108.1 MAG: hypothetical protein A2294_03930 [Candidatus Magasanikbacteria bacterium RIFOXYB2_FULL_38_10]